METPWPLWDACFSVRTSSQPKGLFLFKLFQEMDFCLLPPALSLWAAEKGLAPPSFHCPFRYLQTQRRSLWAISSPGWTIWAISLLQSFHHLHGPMPGYLQWVLVYPALGSPELVPGLQHCLTSAEQKGSITSLDLLATVCLLQPRMMVAFFTARVICWFKVSLLPAENPQVIFCRAAFQPVSPQHVLVPGAGLSISLCWASWCSCWPVSPAGLSPSGCQHSHWVHPPLLLVLHQLQTCWLSWFRLG